MGFRVQGLGILVSTNRGSSMDPQNAVEIILGDPNLQVRHKGRWALEFINITYFGAFGS